MNKVICILAIGLFFACASTLYAAEAKLTVEGETHLATTNGNVGIGTTSPARKLQVAAGQTEDHYQLRVGTTGNYYDIGRNYSDGLLYFTGNQADPYKGFVFNGGNVGIGTTTPQEKLHVNGNVKAKQFITGDIIFTNKATGQPLWNMYEDENGLYLKSANTGDVYMIKMEKIQKGTTTQ